MNYRNAAIAEFTALAKETESYQEGGIPKSLSIGQVMLSILKRKPEGVELNKWLMDISDEGIYTLIEETKFKERP
jgi:hypothetical protein